MDYHEGAAMTAKEEGLRDPIGNVTREEIRHMQARVKVFRATHVVGKNPGDFDHSPECAASWCRWIVVDSIAFAPRPGRRNFPSGAPRQPRRAAALPALGATQPANRNAGSAARVSPQLKAGIAQRGKKGTGEARPAKGKRARQITIFDSIRQPDGEHDKRLK